MDDSRGVMLAFALILFWVAGVAFFTAFHPGGVQNEDGTPAQNPVDVLKWIITRLGEGSGTTSSDTSTGTNVVPGVNAA